MKDMQKFVFFYSSNVFKVWYIVFILMSYCVCYLFIYSVRIVGLEIHVTL
ncbi:hypothetical protein ECHHL_0592 [Ehrlichia chaffeensis str. Heartland]|uniref:Uncharacterized protein n=1 Tax=Ehrlichia chaffeensis (strain ATCC CRL-10679 / Arkansas) TaxID=205920 RepID=Q2GGF7_EHRCR|nr:hypothetical protein ECH_0668 [Ehrlichia chaffeensis str. Arkansas]AHX03747.1 hypothetical protein ECHHL_0592 [Ehrlichia chaffeensis str. Heartland]AHX05532.1 hypothetical protein ECHJAX_0465 [Ehrlichia chaffeensis str. Jax]AHX06521.1 hypothetical protein ECHLIB_0465 [Ehrlichia chaffeensis str. Liberty]AHX07446.1 hypothetical protein ECHOSC_0602 [Ehrlichia chaffeensis str. Osceola]AHX08475.1 hypothetical protein ECHSTV_0452 [Ehrlichia chaffeensis str. Saint Vincent]AHX09704.1 hypothetical 